jgi:hypothetical protein
LGSSARKTFSLASKTPCVSQQPSMELYPELLARLARSHACRRIRPEDQRSTAHRPFYRNPCKYDLLVHPLRSGSHTPINCHSAWRDACPFRNGRRPYHPQAGSRSVCLVKTSSASKVANPHCFLCFEIRTNQPDTFVRWHWQSFRVFWTWKSRSGAGRPKVREEQIDLIKQMTCDTPLWGAPRIRGELLKREIDVSEATVRRYMPARPRRTTRYRRKTFLRNHSSQIVSIDFLVVPTITLKLLHVLVFLSHTDRKAEFGEMFTDTAAVLGIDPLIPAYKSQWQNGNAERLVGSIRRECLDYLIIVNEDHLRKKPSFKQESLLPSLICWKENPGELHS